MSERQLRNDVSCKIFQNVGILKSFRKYKLACDSLDKKFENTEGKKNLYKFVKVSEKEKVDIPNYVC